MTAEEAMKIRHTYSDDYEFDVKELQKVIDEALEKQIPKKARRSKKWIPLPYDCEPLFPVNYDEKTHSEEVDIYVCPCCGEEISWLSKICPCGQKIDWSERE